MGFEALIAALFTEKFLVSAISLAVASGLAVQFQKAVKVHKKELNDLNENHKKDFKSLVETQQHDIKEITEVLTTIGVLVGVVKDTVLTNTQRNGRN